MDLGIAEKDPEADKGDEPACGTCAPTSGASDDQDLNMMKGSSAQFQGYCSHCWLWGHKRVDCRKRLAAEKGGGAGAQQTKGGGKDTQGKTNNDQKGSGGWQVLGPCHPPRQPHWCAPGDLRSTRPSLRLRFQASAARARRCFEPRASWVQPRRAGAHDTHRLVHKRACPPGQAALANTTPWPASLRGSTPDLLRRCAARLRLRAHASPRTHERDPFRCRSPRVG